MTVWPCLAINVDTFCSLWCVHGLFLEPDLHCLPDNPSAVSSETSHFPLSGTLSNSEGSGGGRAAMLVLETTPLVFVSVWMLVCWGQLSWPVAKSSASNGRQWRSDSPKYDQVKIHKDARTNYCSCGAAAFPEDTSLDSPIAVSSHGSWVCFRMLLTLRLDSGHRPVQAGGQGGCAVGTRSRCPDTLAIWDTWSWRRMKQHLGISYKEVAL
jgi:hypothetical protein